MIPKPLSRYFLKTLMVLFVSIVALKIVLEFAYIKTTSRESTLLTGDLMPLLFILIASVMISSVLTYRRHKRNS
ncbi:hypothetical protein SAMN03080601_03632 [Alkalitalea saponilacus]|uniref:Uncharacterized protein n=1 Tax=Alkalitalea saponilacus TaxID=889453 RepID=A0A1T5HUH4_9BACT|nr:hypothetical protein SAMN03080601_03632 [Alkalitalea saponilacus]